MAFNNIMSSQEPVKKCVPFAIALHILDVVLVAVLAYFAIAYMPDKEYFAKNYKENLVTLVFVVRSFESILCLF